MRKRGRSFIAIELACFLLLGTLAGMPAKAYAEEVRGEWRIEKNGDGADERYWYENGIRQGTSGRGKEIYDPEADAWYWLDAVQDGAMARSKDVYMDSYAGVYADRPDGTGKWVRYDGQGRMVKGWRRSKYYDDAKNAVVEGMQYFDPCSGAMAKGMVAIDGMLYEFDRETGYKTSERVLPADFQMNGWNTIDGVDYWFEQGVKQGIFGRGKEICDTQDGEWYWLDATTGGRKALSKDVYLESAAGSWGDWSVDSGEKNGKWVRYDAKGHMVRGWCVGKGSGAEKVPAFDKAGGKDLYYFDPIYGTMAKGTVKIDDRTYRFDEKTGICQGDVSMKPVWLGDNAGAYEYQYGWWSSPIKSYLVREEGGNLMRLQAGGSDGRIFAEYYTADYSLRGQRQIPMELPIFGGFYSTPSNYYIVSGQTNSNESDRVEVIRVTKYDKNWKRLDSAGLYGANTAEPFYAGSLRIAAYGKYLFVHTCHTMYANRSDGLNHQANLTFAVDVDGMVVTDVRQEATNAQRGSVSHSFNQFICVEDNDIITLDHGDAYPRAAVLLKYHADIRDGGFSEEVWKYGTAQVNVLNFPGDVGVNQTGASLGGFAISDSSYLVAGSSVIQDERNLSRATKNVFVAAVDKASEKGTVLWVTGYPEGEDGASNPHFVQLARNSFMLLWTRAGEEKVFYTMVDGRGGNNGVHSMEGVLSDCVPLAMNGKVIWYVSEKDGISFYEINSADMQGYLAKMVR